MNMYDICNFTETSLVSFMHERLDQDCYLLLYDMDEYYLSNGEKYKREHFNHDTYIYGYTDDSFLVLAYAGEHLKRLVIPNQEVVDSLFSKEARKNLDQRRHFSSFRPVIGRHVKADADLICNSIKEFYEPDEEDNPYEINAKGFGVYDEIIRCLENLKEERVDLRAIRVIWEQKELMVKRIKKVFPELSGNCAGIMQEISDRVRLIFKLVMKYNFSCKRSAVERACQMLKDVRDDDLKWYETFFKE